MHARARVRLPSTCRQPPPLTLAVTPKLVVNFPTTLLESRDTRTSVRIGIVNQNVAGSLAKILAVFGDKDLNILQQVNKSRGEIAYNVIDVKMQDSVDWPSVQKDLTTIPEVISSRFILGETPLGGYGYAVNHPEKGYSV